MNLGWPGEAAPLSDCISGKGSTVAGSGLNQGVNKAYSIALATYVIQFLESLSSSLQILPSFSFEIYGECLRIVRGGFGEFWPMLPLHLGLPQT